MPEGPIHIDKLVLAGGGPWTLTFLGGIQYLEHTGVMQGVKTMIGCSAGALICFLMCLGLTSADVRRFVTDKFRKDGCHRVDIDQALEFMQRFGLDDGRRICKALQDALHLYADRDDITFMDFAKLTGKDLIVCVSNLTRRRHEFMCMSRTPHVSVLKALRMSMSIPFMFTPVTHEGCTYVDGGIFNNFPADYCMAANSAVVDTIGFNLLFEDGRCGEAATHSSDQGDVRDGGGGGHAEQMSGFVQFAWALTTAVLARSNYLVHNLAHHATDGVPSLCENAVVNENVLTINFHPQEDRDCAVDEAGIMNFSVSELEFNLSDKYVDACIRYGYAHAKKHLPAVAMASASQDGQNEPE